MSFVVCVPEQARGSPVPLLLPVDLLRGFLCVCFFIFTVESYKKETRKKNCQYPVYASRYVVCVTFAGMCIGLWTMLLFVCLFSAGAMPTFDMIYYEDGLRL